MHIALLSVWYKKSMKWFLVVKVFVLFNAAIAYCEQNIDSSELNKLIEMQNKTLENMQKTLPKIPTLFDAFSKMGEKIDSLEENRHNRIKNQILEIETRIEDVLGLIEDKNFFKAKVKALGIQWTSVGSKSIDEEKKLHYNKIRSEIVRFIDSETD